MSMCTLRKAKTHSYELSLQGLFAKAIRPYRLVPNCGEFEMHPFNV